MYNLLNEYDKLELEITKLIKIDMKKTKELSEKKKNLLSKMTTNEINELLKRPYPSQYKAILKKYL